MYILYGYTWYILGYSTMHSHLDSCHLRCRTSRTMSYVMHVRHRTCDVRHRVVHRTYDVVCTMSYVHDVRHRTCDIVRHVRCRTLTYDIVRHTYDIVRVHLNICRMSEMDIRCRTYMTYDIVCIYRIRHRMYVRCRMSTYDIVC
jgi:hypothetical protein